MDEQNLTEEPKISIKKVILELISKWKTLATAMACGLAIGLVLIMVMDWSAQSSKKEYAAFELYFTGIEDGKTPDGEKYDVTEIESTDILQAAIGSVGMKMSADSLANAMSAKGVLSDSTAQQIQQANNITNDAELKLREQQSIKHNPAVYILTLDIDKLGISQNQGKDLLDAVVQQYRTWLINKYYGSPTLGNVFSGDFSTADFDYIQIADLLSSQADSMESFANSNLSDSFVSASTGYSKSAIDDMITSLRDNEIERIYSIVASEYATKDAAKVVAVYENLAEQKTQEEARSKETANQLIQMIENYSSQSNEKIVFGDSSGVGNYTLRSQSQNYDQLVTQYISAITSAANAGADASYYRSEATRFANAETISDGNSEQAKEIEAMIERAIEKTGRFASIVEDTVKDYKVSHVYQSYLEQILPAAEYQTQTMSGVVLIALGLFGGLFIGIMIVLLRRYLFGDGNAQNGRKEIAG